jgi:hypothetical protein
VDHGVPPAVGADRDPGGGERRTGLDRGERLGHVVQGGGQRRRPVQGERTASELGLQRLDVHVVGVFVRDQHRVDPVRASVR